MKNHESSRMGKATIAAGCALGLAVAGCRGASGTLEVEISGEEAATMGFPVGDIAFIDGWSVSFEHVFIVVEDLGLSEGTSSVSLDADSTLVDLAGGDQLVWSFPGVPAQRWSDVSWHVARPTAETRLLGTVTAADRAAMVAARASFRLVGTATHATQGMVGVDLAVPMAAHMEGCVSGRDGTDGVVVPASGTHRTQLTIHLDHLFFDSARAEEPNLRFDAWAAVAGADGTVTMEDLASQSLADLMNAEGMPLLDGEGNPVAYEPPSSGLPMGTLAAFVLAEAFTIGHFEGEGHCDYHDNDAH